MEYSNFKTLKSDFDSCQLPSAYDPMTVKTLCAIVEDIASGKTTLKQFEDFLAANKMGRTPQGERKARPFGDVCYDFVANALTYLSNSNIVN